MNHIILIGFMGAGKTSVGQALARDMQLTFADTDERIEAQQKKKINDIFAQYGEAYFRDLETDMLHQLQTEEQRLVISVGGGLPVRRENRELLRKLGTVVYLQAQVETLVGRLRGDTTRPKLAGGDLREKIETLMQQREAFYLEAAQLLVATDKKSVKNIIKEIEDYVL
ncbi:shikimate kinase [Marvinbryantia formatexigens DSM 14469]|uniref:Shikimate kinase n=1 Tax=Marvinbryantia formatexigens DSM 14469 TaxID=478749 RepID=C6LM96_9FIRM|nr:shikimate kinase [Marvinbryantia formatexigens]EET58237.1 shikimate kinase [Marvinbryantia formatexigens DSM 14469]UWO23982.1 shikimate kinase [Marvinbryantia formatexigens DSM 14469]SDH22677.1 shikimate kinase [Marvinbryantia formatexigens]